MARLRKCNPPCSSACCRTAPPDHARLQDRPWQARQAAAQSPRALEPTPRPAPRHSQAMIPKISTGIRSYATMSGLEARFNEGKNLNEMERQSAEVLRERGFVTLVAAGVSVHFLQELAHCIELRAEAFPVSGLQSLYRMIVAIERLLCQT
jgi:hypothetical protein